MNSQAVLDVLNSLEVVDMQGGEDSYILVDNNEKKKNDHKGEWDVTMQRRTVICEDKKPPGYPGVR
ncbi:hypothetical protein NDK47_20860 [Brevibacillus ruminantium]|uniref:Uncharacterized protein n=1 Tax=Brevibacillus ruminantium TaxID=2950604 RepID=A0ABY4WBK8_9BACL|nr:hypothetical protein [Brevibacillus ruminantium]USG64572.1 hypothetical protein NDK47_20860 [Brevibacillus ruminantium]